MQIIEKNGTLHQQMQQWRRDIHAHPETSFQEHRTAGIIAELLTSFGLNVVREIAVTGVVATLEGNRPGTGSIGLRADMDALNLDEKNTFLHCSTHPGIMHGCGHDGHTAMLLGAAKYLSENRNFSGTAVFIFQPAEEGDAGAKAMVEEGLFEQFDVDAVYGMHNWPGLATGQFAVHQGPVMAAMDKFKISIAGKGCHAGMPHLGVDPVVVAGQLISSLQSIISRNLDPFESGIISITQMQAGDAHNIIPDSVVLAGTCRSFSPEAQDTLESRMGLQVENICSAFGAKGELNYQRVYPATINTAEHADYCSDVADALVGPANVQRNHPPSMGAEDFAFMLQQRPGAYIWIGNGDGENSKSLHNPYYDFNDEILPLGASYWVELVKTQLPL